MRYVTNKRLHALHNVNRWGGWTKRPYSVLEHSLIGAELMIAVGGNPFPFLLHDMEESEFGDIVTHNKRKFMNARYFATVDRWVADMCAEVGIHPSVLNDAEAVKYPDHVMLHAEHLTVAMIGDTTLFNDKPVTDHVAFCCQAIRDDKYRDVDRAITDFWGIFNAYRPR